MKQFGYAGNILKVDLSSGNVSTFDSADYTDRFTGGRGVAAKLYWDFVPPETGALDPDNCLICTTGPVAGFNGFAGSRWQICGKSPQGDREAFSYANLGGRWGVTLKYAGYDGLVIQGKADKPVYIYIKNDTVEIRDASQLWGESAFEATDKLKSDIGKEFSVLTIGKAAENLVTFATILGENGSSGSAGFGAVMGSKMLKAVVVAGDQRPVAADPDKLKILAKQIREIHKIADHDEGMWKINDSFKKHICYGCGVGCGRYVYPDSKGRKYKSFCQAMMFYLMRILEYTGEDNSDTRLLASRLCDNYGLDTSVMHGMVDWLSYCYKEGILTEEKTGLPFSKLGMPEFIEVLTEKIALREGFGDLLAKGTIRAAESIGGKAIERIGDFVATRNSETKDYDPRLMPATALIYAMEPRRPIQTLHEPVSSLFKWVDWANKMENANFSSEVFRKFAKRIWGSEIAADFTTMEGKALASKRALDRAYVKESMILCDLSWMMIWADYYSENINEPALEWQIFSAVTGKEVDEEGLYRLGERNVNMQRAVLLRQGWDGRNDDQIMDYYFTQPLKKGELFCDPECIVPGKDGEITSVEGRVFDRQDFEKLKDEYYELRGWDVETGLPRAETLRNFEMEDVAEDLAGRGLLK
ncbi:aldehyde ferredoxin oxidoreductase family protein [Thermodesulfobacteriota bacterium]